MLARIGVSATSTGRRSIRRDRTRSCIARSSTTRPPAGRRQRTEPWGPARRGGGETRLVSLLRRSSFLTAVFRWAEPALMAGPHVRQREQGDLRHPRRKVGCQIRVWRCDVIDNADLHVFPQARDLPDATSGRAIAAGRRRTRARPTTKPFRHVIGHFTSGVTVLTTRDGMKTSPDGSPHQRPKARDPCTPSRKA